MSFASPLWLLGLLAVPAAIAAYQASRARARRYAVRFTAVPTLLQAMGPGSSWRRHVPSALALAALAALVLALAKPQRTVAIPVQRASIMLVTDHSRSMLADDVKPSRLGAAKKAARTFLDQLPKTVRVGIVAYSGAPDAVHAPSTDHSLTREVVDAQEADGATATGDALQVAIDELSRDRQKGKRPPAAIVLLSDGKTTAGTDPVEVARASGRVKIPIYTVALGKMDAVIPGPFPSAPPLSVAPDPETLGEIAKVSHGRAFTADDDDELSSIYKRLGSQLGTRSQKREITSGFAVGGLALLLAAAAASLRFAGRLP